MDLINKDGSIKDTDIVLRMGETKEETIDRIKHQLLALTKKINGLDRNNVYSIIISKAPNKHKYEHILSDGTSDLWIDSSGI